MSKHSILILIMFLALLIKALWWAAFEENWTPIRTRKFYTYLSLNLLVPFMLAFLNTRFSSFEDSLRGQITALPGERMLQPGLLPDIILYVVSIFSLALSVKLWPFARAERSTFKTLLMVLLVVLIFEIVTQARIPTTLYTGPLA